LSRSARTRAATSSSVTKVRAAAGAALLQEGDVGGAGARLLVGRGHLAGDDLAQQRRVVGLAGDDLAAGDEFVAVEDVVEAALDGAVLAVAAIAVGLEDLARPGGESRRGVGQGGVSGEEGGEEGVCEGGTLHFVPPGRTGVQPHYRARRGRSASADKASQRKTRQKGRAIVTRGPLALSCWRWSRSLGLLRMGCEQCPDFAILILHERIKLFGEVLR